MYKVFSDYEYKVHMRQILSLELGPNLMTAHLYVQIFQNLEYFWVSSVSDKGYSYNIP